MFSPFLVGGVWRVLGVGVGVSGCSCCFLGVPGGGGVFGDTVVGWFLRGVVTPHPRVARMVFSVV